jgi:hypothetical protein
MPRVGGVGQGKKPQLKFCVSVKPWPALRINYWTLKMLETSVWDQYETLLKGQGFDDIDSSLRGTEGLQKA